MAEFCLNYYNNLHTVKPSKDKVFLSNSYSWCEESCSMQQIVVKTCGNQQDILPPRASRTGSSKAKAPRKKL